jgi:drug/metabolite transporter (DMT)-like permease
MFLKKSGETIPPFKLNLFKVTVVGPLLIVTMLIMRQPIRYDAPLSDYLILFASGIISIAISDTLFHKSLNMIGAGISAIVSCFYSPSVVMMGFFMLRERLTPVQFMGMGMVLVSIVVASGHKPPRGATHRQIVIGVLWGAAAMVTVALGIVIAKPVLNRSPVLWATTMRQIACLAVMVPLALALPRRRNLFSVFRPSASWRFSIPATVLGNYIALIAWIAGMKYTLVGIAAILNQTSTVFILLFATLFLGESLTVRKVVASAVAIGGIILVTFGSGW